ncbi:MAG: hypothetical protein R3B36_30580 [Polyangiaceae bacterium]
MLTRRLALATAAIALVTAATGCKTLFKKRRRAAPAYTMTVSASSVHVGDPILITFGAPLDPPEGDQYWTSLAAVGSPDDDWGTWHYLPVGALRDKHVATQPGAFELRLHDAYPSGEQGVLARVALEVKPKAAEAPPPPPTVTAPEATAGRPTFSIADGREAFASGEKIKIAYSEAMRAPTGQQYWITLAPAGSEDGDWGKWHFVKNGAKLDELETPDTGDFEIRLHDLYPARGHAVIARKAVRVD